jgi:16S rRNA (cytosine(967)-C(5))-methyltransferase
LLDAFDLQQRPLDFFVSDYFKMNKSLGSKDRAAIADDIYGLVRWRALLDHISDPPASWDQRYEHYKKINVIDYLNNDEIPWNIRVSFPEELFQLIIAHFGLEKAVEICLASNSPAPTTVRINPIKTSREALMELWGKDHTVTPTQKAAYGIKFDKRIPFTSMKEFQQGLFEIQDEASQLVADLMEVEPGQQVMDYCSGSGGKTLAFAHKMKGKGQIYLHDTREFILGECRKRLRRAGVQNAQVVEASSPKLKKLKKSMDWVLVDSPCSGTGTLRRNPDSKWKFNLDTLKRLSGLQRQIFEKALSFVKPGGTIVYATCSILQEENENQIAHFLKTYPLKLKNDPFQTIPSAGGMDGFFAAVFTFF